MANTTSFSIFKWILILTISSIVISCNKDNEIETISPSITFDEESGIYTVKAGKSITITPKVDNAVKPTYSWTMDGSSVGSGPAYTFSTEKEGEYFLKFRVDAENGYAEEEIRIDVVEKMIPVVSFPVNEGEHLTAITAKDMEIVAQVKFGEDATYKWKLNNKDIEGVNANTYTFKQTELGDYTVSLTVTNEDGEDTEEVKVKVLEAPLLSIEFDIEDDENGLKNMTVPLGRTLLIAPIITNDTENTVFQWQLDGKLLPGETGKTFEFKPDQKKEYKVTIIGKTGPGEIMVIKSVTVKCVDEEGSYRYPITGNSRAEQNKVYKYLPAPGQFINERHSVSTMDEANKYAENQMKEGSFVSLGGFGGYIIVGFDHSIINVDNEYDFAIFGNAFTGSSEPGIVWVMQDENGNGEPDDTWYELKGSEYGKAETTQNYAVTYYKPKAPGMNVQWRDNNGKTGQIDYLKEFHPQDYYYPNWIKDQSYTLRGTCLKARNELDPKTGNWDNKAYDWGYADNYSDIDRGRDNNSEAEANANYFKIENAIYTDGTPVNLKYIDFVKVQTGVNAKSGWIGELSTEIFGFEDVNLGK